ncbi:hypothetical protein C8R48DRAFT_795874 [Suillus tomentosus]|nr:hypothetical protein C8R48DRAFT_795874 [Suillus tomentosus]
MQSMFSSALRIGRQRSAATTEISKDFRRCHTLIRRIGTEQDHSFPPSTQKTQFQVLTAKCATRLSREGPRTQLNLPQETACLYGT